MNNGLIDANLGSNIYKKRLGGQGKGKRRSFRTLLAFRLDNKAFFIYGFIKNERDNITNKELKALKLLAEEFFKYSKQKLQEVIDAGELYEVKDG